MLAARRAAPWVRRTAPLVARRALSASAAPPPPPHPSAAVSPTFAIAGQSRPGRAIYLDSQATTPLDPRALDAMLPYLTGMYGNPHSVTHQYGWESAEVVDTARLQ